MKKKKRKQKRKINKKIIKFFMLLFIIIATTIFSLVSPIFNITQIKVEGNEKIETETIQSLSQINIGENIFRNSKSKIIENIKENNYIKNVTIKREIPDTIKITVEERNIDYQIKVIDGYIYIDNQGYILEVANSQTKVPTIEGVSTEQDELLNGKRLNEDDINKIKTVEKIREAAKNIEIDDLITTINIESDEEYILYLKSEKKYIYLGDASNLSNKMLYVQTILEAEKGNSGKMFVNGNLSDGFKPYFREE